MLDTVANLTARATPIDTDNEAVIALVAPLAGVMFPRVVPVQGWPTPVMRVG